MFDLGLFGFVCFLFLLVSGKGCSLWLRHSLDFSLTIFAQLLNLIKCKVQSLLMAMLHSLIAQLQFGPQTQWRPLRKTLTSGLGLDDMSLAWPVVVQLLVLVYIYINARSIMKKIQFHPFIFDTKSFMIYENKYTQGNLLKYCKVIFDKKKKKRKKKKKKKKKSFIYLFISDTKSFSAKTLK